MVWPTAGLAEVVEKHMALLAACFAAGAFDAAVAASAASVPVSSAGGDTAAEIGEVVVAVAAAATFAASAAASVAVVTAGVAVAAVILVVRYKPDSVVHCFLGKLGKNLSSEVAYSVQTPLERVVE